MIGLWVPVLGTERKEMGRKEKSRRDWEGATFISMPRAVRLLTMDTVGYSKWGGGLEEVPGGMSNGTASPAWVSLVIGLGFAGRRKANSQEGVQVVGAGETPQAPELAGPGF